MKKVTHTHVPASEAPAKSTLYYMYSQNNTGGRFDVDDEVALCLDRGNKSRRF